jgi:outer membrane immunogenic protein
MKRLLFFTSLFFLIFTSTNIFADPADKGTCNWKGFYAGAQGMYAHGSTDWDYIYFNTHADHTTNGWVGGFFAGYNYQFPINIVLGVETDINYGKIYGSTSAPNPAWLDSSEVNWVGATRIRLGYAVWRFLPYIAAGVAYGRVNISERKLATGLEYNSNDTYVGGTHSLGLEFAFTKNLIARTEYSYYSFGKKTVQLFPLDDSDINIYFRGIKFGLGWKF